MTEEQIRKLLDFLQNDSSPHTGAQCAELVGMKPSTFKKRLHDLKSYFKGNGFEIQGKTGHGNGYILVVAEEEKFHRFREEILFGEQMENNQNLNNQKSRVRNIIKRFIETDDYVKLDDLCEEFALSKAQLNKDMALVRKYLLNYGIAVESRPHYGTQIVADEISKRACLVNLLLDDIGFDKNNGLIRPMEGSNLADDVENIKNIILMCAEEYHYSLTDMTIQNLTLHLYIALMRIRDGKNVELGDGMQNELLDDDVRPLAAFIVHTIGAAFDVSFSIDELCYVILHLSTKAVAGEADLNAEVMEIVDEMLKSIKERYHLDLSKNLDLRISLGLHTIPLLKRLRFHVVCHNPLLEEIQMNYFQAYDFALCACEVIRERYHCAVEADEIGYYALHFATAISSMKENRCLRVLVVCTSGRATSQLLRINIKNYFSDQIERIDTTSFYELSALDLSAYDCVFSTVPIPMKISIPVFQIKTFFDGEKGRDIGQIFREIENAQKELFCKELFFSDIKGREKQEILREMVQRISKCRLVPENFLSSVTEREDLQSTCFGNVALPHTNGVICSENIISCAVLSEPADWGTEKAQIIILTSFRNDFVKSHDSFFEFILELIRNQQWKQKLIETPRYETLMELYMRI